MAAAPPNSHALRGRTATVDGPRDHHHHHHCRNEDSTAAGVGERDQDGPEVATEAGVTPADSRSRSNSTPARLRFGPLHLPVCFFGARGLAPPHRGGNSDKERLGRGGEGDDADRAAGESGESAARASSRSNRIETTQEQEEEGRAGEGRGGQTNGGYGVKKVPLETDAVTAATTKGERRAWVW